jgi:hypothetical protein
MPGEGFYVVQGGTKLYSMTLAGVATELTLPTGITVDATKRLRGAMLNRQLVLCGSPSETLWLDPYGTLRRLAIKSPAGPPILASGGAGTLTGSYRAKYTFFVRDKVSKAVVWESSFSPVSAASASLTNAVLQASNIEIAADTVDGRRVYRTTTGPGTSYFKWVDVEGNLQTVVIDGLGDTGLGLIAAPTDLGTLPGPLELVVEWKDRLWGKTYAAVDNLYYTGNRKHYAWPATNFIPIRPLGDDLIGITGLLPRRDELGVGRVNKLWKVVGDPPNIQLVKVGDVPGPVAPDSCVVIRDRAFYLGADGVYVWDAQGVNSIVDSDVKPWFTTDTYFNRSRFNRAFARYNEALNAYELHLANAGDSSENRWIAYHLDEKKWLGPHKTDAFTPASSAVLQDSNGVKFPVIGDSAGFFWKMNQATRSDGGVAGIVFDVKVRHNHLPNLVKMWLQMAIFTRQEVFGSLTITPAIGELDASDQATPISHDLTQERALLRRLSTAAQPVGAICTLTFRQATDDQDCTILGYEIPVVPQGRR